MIVLCNDTTYPIFTNFLTFNLENRKLVSDRKLIWDVPFGIVVAIFLLIFAVAHFYIATIGHQRYTSYLDRKINPIRFYEYALGSSLMIVLIGKMVGI